MKYSYVALNQDHRKLTGVISAESEKSARRKLHGVQLSVISLSVLNEERTLSSGEGDIITFVFSVIDLHGNKTRGSIDAKNRKSAYYRLVSEYGFEVLSLCKSTTSQELRDHIGKEGLQEIHEELEEEFGVFSRQEENIKEQKTEQSNLFLESKKKLIDSVEEIAEYTEEIMKQFEDQFTADEFYAIKVKLDGLMRLRLSNNLQYIQSLSDDLVTLVDVTLEKHPEIVEQGDGYYLEEVENIDENAESRVLHQAKRLSSRMKGILQKYGKKKKKRRHPLKKRNKESTKKYARLRLFFLTIQRIFFYTKKTIFSSNKALKKRYRKKTKDYFSFFRTTFTDPLEEILKRETEMLLDQEVDIEGILSVTPSRLLGEIHIFLGWLLSFYITYFFLSFAIITQWHTDSGFSFFLQKSLSSSFPFVITGSLFLFLLGITLLVRFQMHIILSSFVMMTMCFGSLVFAFNI